MPYQQKLPPTIGELEEDIPVPESRAVKQPSIEVDVGERVFICGKTGSGKTYLAKYLTASVQRLVVLDGKGTLSDWDLAPWTPQNARALLKPGTVRLRAMAPVTLDPSDFWDQVILFCFRVGHVVIYIDELYAVTPPNKPASNALWAAYTRGRELGVSVWASTQRPVWVPLIAMSEAEHYVVFRLQLHQDRQRLSAFMGRDVLASIRDIHGFWYMRADMAAPLYIKQLNAKRGAAYIRNQPYTREEAQKAKRMMPAQEGG